jgi:hypothetical protein
MRARRRRAAAHACSARAAPPPGPPHTKPPRPHRQIGLQLLLVQPSDGAVLALRAACLAAGTAAPLWLAYKAAKAPPDGKGLAARDRALRLVVASSALELLERGLLAPSGAARWRYWPTAKLALLLWLLLEGGKVRGRECSGVRVGGPGAGRAGRPAACRGWTGCGGQKPMALPHVKRPCAPPTPTPPPHKGADRVYDRVARLLAPYEDDIDALTAAASPLLRVRRGAGGMGSAAGRGHAPRRPTWERKPTARPSPAHGTLRRPPPRSTRRTAS